MKKLMVIDGNSIVNRAFYGVSQNLTTLEGQPTNAIFGFLNIMNKLLDEVSPEALCVTFDRSAPTFRHLAFAEYKANRKGMPEELASQMPLLKDVLSALNIPMYELDGWEADDLLGTIARLDEQAGWETVVVTGDKDSLQLVTDATTVKLVSTRMGRTTTRDMTPEAFYEEYGFAPKHIVDLKALMGDSSDNYPGVKGVGEKTAMALIQLYHTVEHLYSHMPDLCSAPDIPAKPGLIKKLEEGRESARQSYELAVIRTDAPIDFKPEDNLRKEPDNNRLYQLFLSLEFSKLRQRPPVDEKPLGLHPGQHLTQGEVHLLIQLPHAQLSQAAGEGLPQSAGPGAVGREGGHRGHGIGQRAEGPFVQIGEGRAGLGLKVGQHQLFQLVAAVGGGQKVSGHLGVEHEASGCNPLGQQGPAQIFYPVGRLFDGGVGEERLDDFVIIFQLVRPQQAGVPGIVVQVTLHADRVKGWEGDNMHHLLGPPQLQQAPGVLRGDLRLQIAAALQGPGGVRTGCYLPLGGGEAVLVDELGKLQVQEELIQPVVVRLAAQVVLRLEVDGGVGADGGQVIGLEGALPALLQLLDQAGLGGRVRGGADIRKVVVEVGDGVVELDQGHSRLFPHPLDAGVVVGGIPHQRL